MKQTNDIMAPPAYELLELILGSSWLVVFAKLGGVKKWLGVFFFPLTKKAVLQ